MNSLLAGLNAEQAQAVTHRDGPLLVVAGPGSGKTRVLTHRVAALIDSGISPRHIAALTFTNRAAAEMRSRLDTLLGPAAARSATISTFHSLCARTLRTYHEQAGLPPGFTIVDSKDSLMLLTQAAGDAGLSQRLATDERKTFLADVRRAISRAKNAGVSGPAQWAPPVGLPEAPAVWLAYQNLLQASGSVDFDDLLTLVAALGRDPDVGPALSRRFERLLVDEYQDTNAIQQRLVTLFAGPQEQVCAVGDPDQSVYAFRGATGSVADLFLSTYPTADVITLGRNYRSTATICAVSAAVIDANPATHRAVVHTDAPAGDRVVLLDASDPDAEAEWAADQLTRRVRLGGDSFRAAILVRANHQTRPLEKALTVAGVAHAVLGTLRFSDRAEVKDALSWLRLLINPHDTAAAMRAVTVPKRGIGASTAAKLREQMATGADIYTAAAHVAADTPRARTAVTEMVSHLQAARTAATAIGMCAALSYVLTDAGVRRGAVGTGEGAADRAENLSELMGYALTFESDQIAAGASGLDALGAFIETLSLSAADAENADGSALSRVVISTIHAAKGKEFDWVLVAGCEEGVLPHALSVAEGDIAEERRLMFVACSRARQTLVLSSCQSRLQFGSVQTNAPSRFLADVPAHLCSHVVATSARLEKLRRERRSRTTPSADQPWSRQGPSQRTATARTARVTPAVVEGRVFEPGMQVDHTTFGPGTVTAADSRTVTVAFPDGSARMFTTTTAALRGRTTEETQASSETG